MCTHVYHADGPDGDLWPFVNSVRIFFRFSLGNTNRGVYGTGNVCLLAAVPAVRIIHTFRHRKRIRTLCRTHDDGGGLPPSLQLFKRCIGRRTSYRLALAIAKVVLGFYNVQKKKRSFRRTLAKSPLFDLPFRDKRRVRREKIQFYMYNTLKSNYYNIYIYYIQL